MTNISIDLSKSNLPGSISDADFVQDALKKQIKEKIHACLSSSDINESSYRSDAGNNVFFIDGTRGAEIGRAHV